MRFKKDAIGYRDAVVSTDTRAAKLCWTPERVAAANARATEIAEALGHLSVHGGDMLLALAEVERNYWINRPRRIVLAEAV